MNLTKIHVAMCVDRGFTLPLAAALASIDHASSRDSVTVHIVHPGLSEVARERVTSRLSSIEVSWHYVDESALDGAYYPDFLTAASLYRLLLGEILPAEVTRVLYLDADTITLSSLASAYAMELNGAVLGAVRDAGAPWAAGPRGLPWRHFGVSPSSPNLNSGMLLIDLDRWRSESVGERCLDLLRREKPSWGDQDALNVVLQGRWLELPRRWNLQTADLGDYGLAWVHWPEDIEDALRAPSIIHFTEHNKPWIPGSCHPLAEKWFEALDRTAWSGWRPRRVFPVMHWMLTVLRSIRDSLARRYSRLPEGNPRVHPRRKSDPMHYIFVYRSTGIWGGIETQIVRMSHWLVSQGHQVTVITASDRHWGELLPDGVRCIALGDQYWKLNYYFHARRIWRSLGVPRPDVVKSFNWELRMAWPGYQLALITGAKAIAGFYGLCHYLRDDPQDFYLRNFLRNIPARARIFMSPEQIEELEERYGQGGELWLLPVDFGRFLPAARRPAWGRIVSIGRMGDMKGYNLYMIEVVEELIRRGHEVTWTAYGTGEYEAEMREMIRARKLEAAIALPGPMPYEQCRQALAEAYVFVGMGTSIVEASLFGVPNVLAVANDRTGMTYGPLYNQPLGSVGDVLKEPPTLTVADEIERLLRLAPEAYAQEAERVGQYAHPYESEVSMRRFVEIVEAAPPLRRRFWPCLVNYLYGPRRHLTRLWDRWWKRFAGKWSGPLGADRSAEVN